MKLTEIKPNPNNPRTIKDANFIKLCKSIQEFPKMMELRPMVLDENNVVLGGNMRLKALTHLGFTEIPDNWVKKSGTLTPEEIKRFIIIDNVGYGEWDLQALAEGWDSEILNEWGLDVNIKTEKFGAEEDEFEIPEEITTDIVHGDLFEIGNHRLLCGSSTSTDDVKKLMNGKLADIVLTDPPYNVDYEGGTGMKIINDKMSDSKFYQFLLDFYIAFASITKNGGVWYVWHTDNERINFTKAFQNAGLYFTQCLIWVKNSLVLGRLDYHKKHETCLYGWKPGAAHYFTNDRTKTTVIEDKIDFKKLKKEELLKMLTDLMSDDIQSTVLRADKPTKNDLHPTMKPILLLAPLIQNSSKINEIVADGFLGSGSTMVASHQLKRKCYGMELDPKYCQVIVDRMIKLDPTITILKNGKPYERT